MMRLLAVFPLLTSLAIIPFIATTKVPVPPASGSPLAAYSPAWNDARYLKCNTASKANYLSPAEKDVIYILNLARMNPDLFASSVVKKYPDNKFNGDLRHSRYYTSLLKTMQGLKPLSLLYPDSLCFDGAQCHAVHSGEEGYVGHTRSTRECMDRWYYNGECCDYGNDEPLEIIMSLLIDEGVPSLGHRMICLASYKKIGVAIRPHKAYGYTTVLDFHY